MLFRRRQSPETKDQFQDRLRRQLKDFEREEAVERPRRLAVLAQYTVTIQSPPEFWARIREARNRHLEEEARKGNPVPYARPVPLQEPMSAETPQAQEPVPESEHRVFDLRTT